jgi:mannose-6-phosphate isomerase-like protein (cupin superfamily)
MQSSSDDHDHQLIVRHRGEGQAVRLLGNELTFKATSESTNGKYALCEYLAPAGFNGPPPHTHGGFDELWYVLEGELTLQADQDTVVALPGAFVQVPGSIVHTFANRSQAPVRFLLLLLPGGFENYFLKDLPAVVAQHGYPPPPEVVAQLADRYGLRTFASASAH